MTIFFLKKYLKCNIRNGFYHEQKNILNFVC